MSGVAPCPQPAKLSKRDLDKVRENRFELTNTKADVIFAFYGYNESFAGEAGLAKFQENVAGFIKHTLAQKYNGKSAPKLVLFSPIGHEFIDDPNLPSKEVVAASNARLKMYSEAMGEVAKANGVKFIDIFLYTKTPSIARGPLKGQPPNSDPITINGIHLNAKGDMKVAVNSVEMLFYGPGPELQGEWWKRLEPMRLAINDKNFYWFNRYRVTDGFSTYGERAFLKFSEGPGGYGDGLSNYSVGQRELDVLDQLTSNRDVVVWAAAQGKKVEPIDSALSPFIPVITNKPGPLEGGKHLFLSGQEAIEKMTVHKNMKVELFADETMFPELVKPVQMSFDTKGRLWVACWRTYPHWKPTEKMDDRLLILEDTNNDGRADVCKTFAGDIHNPTGFEFWNGGVLVAQGPDLLFLKDTDGDDKYDIKERLVHGFDTADTHHTINSFVLDPGGAIYMQEGTFHHSQIETPWGPPRRLANGGVFRYEPRTQKTDIYVTFGFANPHGHVFDAWGQDIVVDGTGANPFHGPLFSSQLDYPNKHNRPPQVYQQRTRPCSAIEILSSSHFPEEHRGNLLVANVIGFQGILQYKLHGSAGDTNPKRERGREATDSARSGASALAGASGYSGIDEGSSLGATEVEPIVFSSDANFRPGDVEVGPDGAIYFTDWQNPIIGHMQHNLRDPSRDHDHGRVYRVTYEGRPLVKTAQIAGQATANVMGLLDSPDDRVRYQARIELSGRPTNEVIAATQNWLKESALMINDPRRPSSPEGRRYNQSKM
ncbi:MAG: dehydrogenase, partial [Candidatus Saccharimonas sp.]|nr:dehydrogenase [Planctomycetaceae bacterium]